MDWAAGADRHAVSSDGQAAAETPLTDRLTETPRLDVLPVFVRAGTILPRQPLVQSTARTPVGPLTLEVYPGPDCAGMLYFDDGHSMAFERGVYLRQSVRCATTADGRITVTFDKRDGSYSPWWKEIDIVVHGWQGPAVVMNGGTNVPTTSDAASHTVRMTVPDIATGGTISFATARAK